jgi:hypothetical protein
VEYLIPSFLDELQLIKEAGFTSALAGAFRSAPAGLAKSMSGAGQALSRPFRRPTMRPDVQAHLQANQWRPGGTITGQSVARPEPQTINVRVAQPTPTTPPGDVLRSPGAEMMHARQHFAPLLQQMRAA